MDTEVYEEKRKNKSQIETILETIQKYEPIIKIVIRVVLSLLLWTAIVIMGGTIWGILAISGSAVPALLFFVPIIIGGILSFVIWSNEVYERIKAEIAKNIKGNIAEQIAEQFKNMSPEELQEARKGIAKFRGKIGLDSNMPEEKRKRDQIDAAIAKLSDSQLLDLKQGIKDGSIEEDDLLDWLNEQDTIVDEI